MKIWDTLKATVLLATLTGLLIVTGSAWGGQAGLVMGFGLAIIMNMGAWWFSDKIALRMSGAREVSYDEAPDLHRIVEALADRANLPKPRVYLIETESLWSSSPDGGAIGGSGSTLYLK